MAKIIQKYGNFTTKELDEYASEEDSCVRKVNSEMHTSIGPYGLADFKHALHAHLIQTKVGFYDFRLAGIVLGIKNIKVLGTTAHLRTDDPAIHINIRADFYVFCPKENVVLSGVVKHVSQRHVSVIIYRVFNAAIRYSNKLNKNEIVMNQEIKFRIKNFDMQSAFPYIDGEILLPESDSAAVTKKNKKKSIKFNGADSGFEDKDDGQPKSELDSLLDLIKQEPKDDDEEVAIPTPAKRKKKDKTTKETEKPASVDLNESKELKNSKKAKKIKVEPID